MRILLVSPYLPWPLQSGGNAAVYSTLQCLSEDHAFTLLCPVDSDAQIEHARILAERLPRVTVRAVFCGFRQARREFIALRMVRRLAWVIRRWVQRRSQAPASPTLPYNPFYTLPAPFVDALAEEVALKPDLVQCEFAEMMPVGGILPSDLPRLFTHIQIHHVYASRFVDVHGATPNGLYLVRWMRMQEQAYLREYDAIITFSQEDREALRGMFPLELIYDSPYPLPADVGIADTLPDSFDGRFIFLGSEAHAPNQDALAWLLEDIWPRILRANPKAELHIIGPWSQSWQTRAEGQRAKFPGFVENLSAALRGGIMLVPVRIGSGIRTKILAAFAQGVPVVSTAVGCEGLLGQDGQELLIRNAAEEIADAALQLANDSALRRRLGEAALALVTARYSPAAVRRRRNEIYSGLMARGRRPAVPN